VFVCWLWWRLPKRQVDRLRHAIRDPMARTDVEDNFGKTVGQLLGGAAVLIGATFAYLQFTQQQRSAHDLLGSNQVAKGFELQGNNEYEIPQWLGSIYALEGVMNTSKDYYRPVLEALRAFVRDGTKAQTGQQLPASDAQAALAVIGRRTVGEGRPDLIPKAHQTGAHLEFAHLDGAYLSGAILSEAHLIGADLSGANLEFARLDGARLFGADLLGANLSGAVLINADLSGAHVSGAKNLTQPQLDFACGDKTKLDPPLTIKPCPPDQPPAGGSK
jgi:uncharacterized protein YjbI with pentapeptide repeats